MAASSTTCCAVCSRVADPARAVTFADASAAEREAFARAQIAEYASQKTRAGQWSREEAPARAEADVRGLLARAGMRVLRGVDEHGDFAAWVWVGPVPSPTDGGAEARWLYQITVPEQRRGEGLGAGALAALERLLAREGVRELRLNVFAWNAPARRLYEAAGYATLASDAAGAQMGKHLAAARVNEAGERARPSAADRER